MKSSSNRSLLLPALLMALGCLLLAGCAGTRDRDSELPWNAPQPWEGSPMIPGLNQGR